MNIKLVLCGITTVCCLYGTYNIALNIRDLVKTLQGIAQSLSPTEAIYTKEGM